MEKYTTQISNVDSMSVTENTPAVIDDCFDFDLTISGSTSEYYITYDVILSNNSVEDVAYRYEHVT